MSGLRYRGMLVTVMACAVFAAPILAGEHEGAPQHFDREIPFERMVTELALTAAQQDTIKNIMQRTRSAVQTQRDQLKGTHKDLQGLMQAEEFDEHKARALIAARQQPMAELMLLRLKQHFDIRRVLTPAQREKFRQLRPRTGHGPGHGPGMHSE